jgi:hypothetical protein
MMKKHNIFQKRSVITVLSVIFLMNIMTVAHAQSQFSLGLKVAGNAANYLDFTKKNFGLEAGLFMRLGDRFFFEPEVNYVFKSSTITKAVDEFNENMKLKQHYVSVPALLGYHFINNENFRFRLTLGPRFDFKVADNNDQEGWKTGALQWGGQAGVGIDFWRFALDFNYYIAADRFKNSITSESQTKLANSFILSLGFKIVK